MTVVCSSYPGFASGLVYQNRFFLGTIGQMDIVYTSDIRIKATYSVADNDRMKCGKEDIDDIRAD